MKEFNEKLDNAVATVVHEYGCLVAIAIFALSIVCVCILMTITFLQGGSLL
jgi:hypothetical protein